MYRPLVLLPALAALVCGCATLDYYAHAINGQLEILARSRPIEDLLNGTAPDAPTPSTALGRRLATVLRVRSFATESLGLPDNGSYREYAELDRAAVAWNVIATPEFSLKPERWCYPFAGCVPYRGFFARPRAQQFAGELRHAGLDVRIATVSAYSTLGWLRDPVLSTQLQRDDVQLAAVLFHELAHQLLYVSDDTAFNESFATFVERRGLQRWLAHEGDSAAYERWLTERARHAQFLALLREYRHKLEAVFDSGLAADAMRAAKAGVFTELRAAYRARRAEWGDDGRYDSWFAQELNNAHLAGIELYHRHVSAFEALFRESDQDLRQFYRAARRLARLPAEEREARLAALATGAPTAH
jgi:predicted aminopeptidase